MAKSLRDAQEHREPSGYWHPTQIGKCKRQAILEHAGIVKNELDDRSLRVFWMGNRIHEALQNLYIATLDIVATESSFRNEEFKVSGRGDMTARDEGGLVAVEFKSVNSNKFKYGNLPETAHVLQLACSLKWPSACPAEVEDHGSDTAPQCHLCLATGLLPLPYVGRLVYWSKDDALMEEFVVRLTPEIDQRIEKEFTDLENLYKAYETDGSLPPALDAADWRIRYCGYSGTGQCCGDSASVDQPPLLGSDDSPSESDL